MTVRVGVIGAGLMGTTHVRLLSTSVPAAVRELQSWVASIAAGAACGASAWDGYAASAVCDAALESLTTREPTEIRLAARPPLYQHRPPRRVTRLPDSEDD
jgi:hypothetical protein